jgi:hypothetical protein
MLRNIQAKTLKHNPPRTQKNLRKYLQCKHYISGQILFYILQSRNIPGALLKAIVDMHTQNKTSIKFNSKLSKLAKINRGVRQGCPVSPTQFNIYLDEIIT